MLRGEAGASVGRLQSLRGSRVEVVEHDAARKLCSDRTGENAGRVQEQEAAEGSQDAVRPSELLDRPQVAPDSLFQLGYVL